MKGSKTWVHLLIVAVLLWIFSLPAFAEDGSSKFLTIGEITNLQRNEEDVENSEKGNCDGEVVEYLKVPSTLTAYNVEHEIINGENGDVYGEIRINKKAVLRIRSGLNGFSIAERTQIVAQRLYDCIEQGLDPSTIYPVTVKGIWYIFFGENQLITVDHQSAVANDSTEGEIAYCWANLLRTSLGAEKLEFEILAVNAKAAYYGDGNRTASGEVFDPDGFTAAHRTLPFGTRLLVSDLQTRKSVIVRINDRGPFTKGREVDLSRGAAEVLGSLGRGIYEVKVYILGQN